MFIAHASAPAFATIYNWMNEFKRGHTSTCDVSRSGCPIEVVMKSCCQKSSIKSTILFWLIDEWKCARLSRPQAYHMVQWFQFCTNNWVEKTRWALRLLTVDHKRDRVTISKQCLEMFQRNPDEFLRQFITVDETWIHYFTPETKESKQWTSPDEPALKKAKIK